MFDFFGLDPEKTVKKAEELRSEGRIDKALNLILKALKSNPENSLLNLKAFEYHLYANRERDSFVYFQKALKSKKYKREAEKILLENLSRIGLEKHREHYFENLIEEFKLKEAKEFFKNLDRKEIEKLRERYKKFVDEIYRREIEKPTRGLLRGLLILSIIEWEYGNYEESREVIKEAFRLFPDAREQTLEVIEEETKYGKNRIFANFIVGELFYLFEDEEKGVALLERILTQDESYFEKIKDIFTEKLPETKRGKRFYAQILIREKNYKELFPFLEGLDKKELTSLLEKIDIEKAALEPEILKRLVDYFKKADLKSKIIDTFYITSKLSFENSDIFLKDAKGIIEEGLGEEYLRKFLEGIKRRKDAGKILMEIYSKNPEVIGSPEFSGVLNEIFEEIPEDKNFLEVFALSLMKSGGFEEGIEILHYILRNFEGGLSEDLISFIEENKDVMSYYPTFYEVLYEINLLKGENTEEILLEFFRKFSELQNRIVVFLDDLGERRKDLITRIIDDIRYVEEKEELPEGIISFLKGELYIKGGYYKEAADYYYKAFKSGVKWVRKRAKELAEEITSPYIKLLNGKILIDDGKIEEGAEIMITGLREEPEILKDVAAFLRNKMSREKNIHLSIPYLEILIMQKYYEPALTFAQKLMDVKDKRLKGEILSLYSQALWKTGKLKEAQEIIKKLLAERYPFDPVPLINFFEEELKSGRKSAFIYQTLGTLYILNQEPSKAAMCYFNLAFLNPRLSEKIKNMLVSIESQFPENPGIKCAKAGIDVITGKEIQGYEEIENIIETEKKILELETFFDFIYKKEEPYPIYLRALIDFHKGNENYIEHLKKIDIEELSDYLKDKIENLLERGVEKNLALWESLLYLFEIYLQKNKKDKIFEYIKEKGLPEDKEKVVRFRKFFIELQEDYGEDKAYNFYMGLLLLKLSDSRGFFFLEKSLPEFVDEIYERFDEIRNYKNSERVLLRVSSYKRDLQKFREIFLKLSCEFILNEYEFIQNLLPSLPYEREVYRRIFNCLLDAKDKRITKFYKKIVMLEDNTFEKIKVYLEISNTMEDLDIDPLYQFLIENSEKKEVVEMWERAYREVIGSKKEREMNEEEKILQIARVYERKGKIWQSFEFLENYRKRKGGSKRILKRIKYLREKLFGKNLLLKLEE